ncbi:MAG: LptF/LptG family permease [Bacteroidia bacterium]|nr:LptF/LptG family permease [Bacteroidia bacterium]
MNTLTRYTISAYLGPFVLTFFISLFVLFMQFLWKWFEDFVGKGIDVFTLTEVVFYVSLTLVPMALPLAILLSSLMTFGNLGEHYELVALKSAGLSLGRIMRPLTVFILGVCCLAFVFSNNILPFASLKGWTIVHSIAETKPAMNLKPGAFYSGILGYVIRIEGKSDDGNILKGITIYDHTQGMGNTRVTTAESGSMQISDDKKHLIVTLKNGHSADEMVNQNTEISHPYTRTHFMEQRVRIDLRGFELKRMDEDILSSNYDMLNIGQIEDELDSLKRDRAEAGAFFMNRVNNKFFRQGPPHKTVQRPVSPFKPSAVLPLPNPEMEIKMAPPANDRQKQLLVLERAIQSARASKTDVESYMQEKENLIQPEVSLKLVWHKKFTLSFACLVLFFIGAPLGAIIRKGGLGMPAVVSILLFILYYILSITGEKFAKELIISPFFGAWAAPFILLPLGVFLSWKATTDSTLFDANAYLEPVAKLFKRRRR